MKLVVYSSLLAFPHGVWRYSMNKILIGTVLAVTSTITLSAQSNSNFDGFYVGASAGYSSLDAKEKVGIINPTTGARGPSHRVSFSPQLKSNNSAGSVHAGYGNTFAQKWYLGTEFSIIFDNHKTKYKFSDTNDGSKFSDALSRKYAMAFIITPGYYIKEDVLFNLKTGISISKFTYKMEDNYSEASPGGDRSFLSTSRSTTAAGFAFGAGIKISMTEKLSTRLDVDHTIYRNFRVSKVQRNDHVITTNVKPTVTTVMVGVSYKI